MTTTRMSTAVVCGVPIDDLTLDETVDRVADLVERGRATGRSHQVATVNVDFVVNAMVDPSLLTLLQHVDLTVADGMPIVWGAKLLGSPLRERVAGVDLVPALARRCAARDYTMYLFGGTNGVAGHAADVLRARNPGLRIHGESGPYFAAPEDMDAEVVDRIRSVRPDVLCVALGHPKQERWIHAYRDALGVPVLIGVGGSLNFLTGVTRRAPVWMQRSGVEWMHRAVREPRRLVGRYARDAVRFGPQLIRDLAITRGGSPGEAHACDVRRDGAVTVVRPRGRLELSATTLGWTVQEWTLPPTGQHVIIDLADLPRLGHSELADIVGLARRLRERDGHLTLAAVPGGVARTIIDLRLYDFLSISSRPIDHGTPAPASIAQNVGETGQAPVPTTLRTVIGEGG